MSFPDRPPPPVAREESLRGQAVPTVAVLRELRALEGTGDEILEALGPRARVLQLEPGQFLLRRGEPNSSIYVVVSGRLRVELDGGSSLLAQLGRGETIGELSLLTGSLTTATVAAEERTLLLVLDEQTFWWMVSSSHEFCVGLLIRLAERMRSNTDAVQANIALRRHFEQAALSDALTGLHNRRWLDQMLPRFVQRHMQSSEPLCVAIMDIDHFKRINDGFGHPAGDAVLTRVAQLLRDNLRPTDFAARMGGEEFALIFCQTPPPGAVQAAERLREAIARASFDCEGRRLPQVTVSLGVAELERTANAGQLLQQADAALYRAKESGRNRTLWAGSDTVSPP